MKKLAISLAITSAISLTACDDTSLEDVQQQTSEQRAQINQNAENTRATPRVVFSPADGELSVPNDLLFSGTTDLTLQMPDETSALAKGEAVNFGNPSAALGALDGWGTQSVIPIAFEYDAGTGNAINPATLLAGVQVYEVKAFPNFSDPDCSDAANSGALCKGVAPLVFGQDFVASISGNSIVVVPVKPLKAGTTYAVALTNDIQDVEGNSLLPASTYASVKLDIATLPIIPNDIADEDLTEGQAGVRGLQAIVNSYENVLARDLEVDKSKIVYTQVFTTQSAGVPGTDPLQITKLLNAQALAAAQATDALSVATPVTRRTTEVEGVGTVELTVANVNPAFAGFEAAKLYQAEISVPYYLDIENPLTGRWTARCDSGITLGALTTEQLAALSANAGDDNEFCQGFGLADLGVDTARHLTKFNPIPEMKSEQTIPVQITIPDEALIPGSKPASGWPVVVLQHGITSRKEDMLAMTNALSLAGLATVAIDHPLHGERGVQSEDETWINATGSLNSDGSAVYPGNSATHYLNLENLLTGRDNLRQSVADSLNLRLKIATMFDPTSPTTALFDNSKVYYVGHSLGAITGTGFTAVANTPVTAETVFADTGNPEVDQAVAEGTAAALNASYKVNAVVLANPGAGIGNFLIESPTFGPLVQALVTIGAGDDISNAILANIADIANVIPANLSIPSCALAAQTGSQNDGAICAFSVFMASASDAQKAQVQGTLSQFIFAAQTLIDAGDPTNYTETLKTLQTPVLMLEIAGSSDAEGEVVSPSDLVIPNTVSTDPANMIAGTTGLANQLGLSAITDDVTDTPIRGIARFTSGSHSSLLNPTRSEEIEDAFPNSNPLGFAAVTIEMQTMVATFIASDAMMVPVSDSVDVEIPGPMTVPVTCIVQGATPETCSAD